MVGCEKVGCLMMRVESGDLRLERMSRFVLFPKCCTMKVST